MGWGVHPIMRTAILDLFNALSAMLLEVVYRYNLEIAVEDPRLPSDNGYRRYPVLVETRWLPTDRV